MPGELSVWLPSCPPDRAPCRSYRLVAVVTGGLSSEFTSRQGLTPSSWLDRDMVLGGGGCSAGAQREQAHSDEAASVGSACSHIPSASSP